MSRPIGPKKQAALIQLEALRKQGLPDTEIRQALIEAGLTKAQALELLPTAEEAAKETKPIENEAKQALINGAIHFLETVGQRLKPDVTNRFPDTVTLKGDALTWARKLKGAL